MDEGAKKILMALLAVSIEGRGEEAKKIRKDEALLTEFGLSATEIAEILGKSKAAVAKAIQRRKKSQ